MNVRVRGIYATALTGLFLEDGHEVIDASLPIRERFDADLGEGVPDVTVDTTEDRQGVGLHGESDAVAAATALLEAVARDTFTWDDPAPRGTVFDGAVTETLGTGAVVDLGVTEGFLPYDATAEHVDAGDRLRVQVREPVAPWDSHRSEFGTEIRAAGQLVTLVPGGGTRVDSHDEAAGRELAGMTELLGIEPPADWGIHWHQPAVGAGMGTLEAALSRAVDRAEAIEDALTDAGGTDPGTADATGADSDPTDVGEPGRIVAPTAGAWVWFGREARFALDDRRRETATTMTGHHRIKAGSRAASAGVDFAEALCNPTGEFPFGVVLDQFGPHDGDTVRIEHGKPDGRLIVLGEGEVSAVSPGDGTLTVTRKMTPGGTYDELDVARESGDTATTKLKEGRWWYPTTYRDAEGTVKGTYVNVCTPVEVFPDAVRYVDLHVDVVKHADGTVERVDDDRLQRSVDEGHVSRELAEKARSVATAIENAL